MNKTAKLIIWTLFLLSFINYAIIAIAQEKFAGNIDWTKKVIEVNGSAQEEAQENLWEIINNIRMDKQNLLEEFIQNNAGMEEQINKLIEKNAVTKERKKADGRKFVDLTFSLDSEFNKIILSVQSVGSSKRPPFRFGPPAANPAPIGPSFMRGPTGLIIDARGLKLTPSLAPKILDEDDRIIYGLATVNRSYATNSGFVKYMRDLERAETSPQVANNPIVVKAIDIDSDSGSDIIISSQDAEMISRRARQYDFLHKCRVIIIID